MKVFKISQLIKNVIEETDTQAHKQYDIMSLHAGKIDSKSLTPSGNPDNNLESLYPCSNVFGLQSDCKLLSGFPKGIKNYSV
jgi:hypothetical protein